MSSDDAPEQPPQPPTTGLIASKYQLVRLIGRGGMGTVWEGRHASLGTRVAIKFIDIDYADSQEARSRFDNEARAAATIQSKHAIQIYDHGVTEDGKPYIVMELLQGEPLDQRIDRVKRLSLQETARILRQVARALQRAHELGIVHRDLKPENIFLVRTPDEDDEIAKVLDFGIAKFKRPDGLHGSPGGLTSSTKTGAVLGTPFYMSPEQARGLREVDHRTDLWSMGVIAYKCVAGVLPFEGVSVGDLLVKICTSTPPVPSHVVPGLPTSFDAWFARALERDPARRFASAQELSDALAYAAGVSVRRPGNAADPIAATVAASGPPARLSGQPPRVSTEPSQPVAMSGQGYSAPGAFHGGAPGYIPPAPPNDPRFGLTPGAGPGGAAVTSAPFTASSPRASGAPRSAKGVVAAAVGAALVGAAIGVFAIVKLAGPTRAASSGSSAAVATAATGHASPAVAPSAGAASPDGGAAVTTAQASSSSSNAPSNAAQSAPVADAQGGAGAAAHGKHPRAGKPVIPAPSSAPSPSGNEVLQKPQTSPSPSGPMAPQPPPAPKPSSPAPPSTPAIDPGY